MMDTQHLPRTRAVAGEIDLPDAPAPAPACLRLPPVLVASAAESGPRFYVTRELGLDMAFGAEDSAPQLRRRGRR